MSSGTLLVFYHKMVVFYQRIVEFYKVFNCILRFTMNKPVAFMLLNSDSLWVFYQ